MAKRLTVDQPIIEPVYSQSSPNESIDFGSIKIQFEVDGETHTESANAKLDFSPEDRLSFTVPPREEMDFKIHFRLFEMGKINLFLPDRNVSIEAFCSAINENGILFLTTRSGIQVQPPTTKIQNGLFHLFNFPDFNSPDDYILEYGTKPRTGAKNCGCIKIQAEGWIIQITALTNTDELEKSLKVNGGYVITHVGSIVREDGSTFSDHEFNEFLTCLHYFLSFVIGRWAGLTLPVGFDSDENLVFEEWGTRRNAGNLWNSSNSWFSEHHGELIAQVFPGFIALWKNELWNRPITEVLYWYLGASDRGTGIGTDTGLILSQTALELLSWNYCVLDRKLVSKAAFRPGKLTASDKLRLLASSLNIPLEIPTVMTSLLSNPGRQWDDSFDALTAIRNSLVHPDPSSRPTSEGYYDAWRLSLWYIDLVILSLCKHNGKYRNRIHDRGYVGEVVDVPWVEQ